MRFHFPRFHSRFACFVAFLGLLHGSISLSAFAANPDPTIARCGAGFIENVSGYRVLHLKGSPYEMGFQHGTLLKDDIRELVRFLFEEKAKEADFKLLGQKIEPKAIIKVIVGIERPHVSDRFFEELKGLADGSGVPLDDLVAANFIPELFHCSGFAIKGSATRDGTLYHGRILDYGCDWRLQEHAVLVVAQPEGKIPFVNVTYSGFIGSVTGMNAKHISIGEMGGKGLGHWAGVPMPLLVRTALEEAGDLDRALAIFRDHPRTCQYFYVIADGDRGEGVGLEASWDVFGVIRMGEAEKRLPHAIPDAVLMSVGKRYEKLAERVIAGHGTFDAVSARSLMDRPVAMKSNLHSVLFEPKSTRLWVANASIKGEPASNQPYHEFQLEELLKHLPDPAVIVTPCPPRPSRVDPASAKPEVDPNKTAGSIEQTSKNKD